MRLNSLYVLRRAFYAEKTKKDKENTKELNEPNEMLVVSHW